MERSPTARATVGMATASLLAAFLSGAGCGDRTGTPRRATVSVEPLTSQAPWFIDATADSGLNFVHFNGMTGEFFYPEIIGPGVALFDYDGDGDLDVFLVQGQPLGSGRPLFPEHDPFPLKGRLFRNDLTVGQDGTRSLHFTDVTDASGINATGYGMGVAAGDYNNDGCIDLYVTKLGRNQLFRNNCNGTFTDVSQSSGTADSGWSVSAAFLDYDRDGWLDLYVGHYLNWDIKTNSPCFGASGSRAYCAPRVYRAQPSHLYHNNRDGTFTDVTAAAGMAGQFGPALGVATADFNGDGWIDLYVTNDGYENLLWINQRDGTFKNLGLLSGAALNPNGKAKAGMGVDAGDFNGDGSEDLFVTNLTGEGHDLYANDGTGIFENQSGRSQLGYPSLPYTGFGTAWFDFDNDGWLDLLTVNGTVQIIESLARARDPFPLRQRKQLFRNLGNGQFEEVSARAGSAFETLEVGRGAAFGDIDNDGDTDVVIANNNGPARLLLNNIGQQHHWIGLRLIGRPANESRAGSGSTRATNTRDMLGARVEIIRPGLPTLWRRARADGSYASANDPRVLAGLGTATEAPRVRVIWPSGKTEEWPRVEIDRYTTLTEGSGK